MTGIAPGVGIHVRNGSLVVQSVGKAQQCNLITRRFISLCAYQIVARWDVVKLLVCVVSSGRGDDSGAEKRVVVSILLYIAALSRGLSLCLHCTL